MNPKVSIIVPVYKVEAYIKICIDSILNQTFKDFELILVDDGSPDNCGKICDDYANKDSRIKVIHKQNGGLSSARNCGIKVAKGEYIGFIDSDDYIHKRMYEMLYVNAVKHSAEISICDFQEVYDGEQINIDCKLDKMELENLTNIQALNKLYKTKTTFVIACNKLYRKELFENDLFQEGKIYEDEFIMHKLLYKSNKIIYVKNSLYFYLQRKGSIVHQKYSLQKFDKLYALKERINFFKELQELDLQFNAEKVYIEMLLWNYYVAKEKLYGINKELKELRRTVELTNVIKNPLLSWKYKIMICLFIINPQIYEICGNFYDKKLCKIKIE